MAEAVVLNHFGKLALYIFLTDNITEHIAGL